MATKARSKRANPPERAGSRRAKSVSVRPPRPVLVATDGSKPALAAVRFARAMEVAGAWKPEAMTVLEHLPVAVGEVALPMPVTATEHTLLEARADDVRRQLRRARAHEWPFRSELGSAVHSIVDFAARGGVDLIVLGLGKHGKLARLMGAETAARVARRSQVPVLAVDEDTDGPAKSIVAALDFGSSSVRAVHEALELLPIGGRLHLLHVRWGLDGEPLGDEAWERTYAMGVEQGFARLRNQIDRPGVRITTEMKVGGTVESIVKAIQDRKADVVAVGSHSRNVVDRLLLGSTAVSLLHAAKCSVLVAPAE